MLTEYDIDVIHKGIDTLSYYSLYYIAHDVECREGYIDEVAAKSNPKFSILELNISNVYNAYYEYLKYIEFPERYHTESLTTVIDKTTKYVRYYTVPNDEATYTKPFNPHMPSIIYGVKRNVYMHGELINSYNDPSPVKPVYVHEPLYYGVTAWEMFNNGELDWKYRQIDDKIIGTDWYILEIQNMPRTEHHLINVKQKNAFFMNLEDALSYRKELLA